MTRERHGGKRSLAKAHRSEVHCFRHLGFAGRLKGEAAGQKTSKKDGGVEIASHFIQQNNQWMSSIRLPTLWNMDPIQLQLPRPEIAAREVDPDHVDRLYESFQQACGHFSSTKANFDSKLLLPRSLRREVISGSHSFLAVTRLQRDFPEIGRVSGPYLSG